MNTLPDSPPVTPVDGVNAADPQWLDALAQNQDVINETITIGTEEFLVLRPRDTNALLDGISSAAFAVDERLPYWAQLWPSSVELARYCLEDRDMCGQRVLDLGCGLGLAGIAAARAGAHVIFADYESDALSFARYNASRNLSPGSRMEFRLMDWRADDEFEPVDVVMGADIVYELRSFAPILKLVRRILRKDGRAVFTDPDRSTGMTFFALAEMEGFEVSINSHRAGSRDGTTTILLGELRIKEPVW